MLKGHRACIDLDKNVLRIQGREVKFLSEHELPAKARDPREADPTGISASTSVPSAGPSAPTVSTPQGFPGGGRTIGSAPAPGPPTPQGATALAQRRPQRTSGNHPEQSIRTLMDLGVSRELAVSTLDAAGGNVDVAASLLF